VPAPVGTPVRLATRAPTFVVPVGVPYDALMFAMVWHYWIGVALAIGAVATIAGVFANYLKKVESIRYPKGR
jgi:hypothetical protein